MWMVRSLPSDLGPWNLVRGDNRLVSDMKNVLVIGDGNHIERCENVALKGGSNEIVGCQGVMIFFS